MQKLYRNIKERRKLLGLTQGELAKMVGYADKSMIARVEKGEIDLSQSKVIAIAKALGTTPGDLTGQTDQLPRYKNVGTVTTRKFPVLGSIACGEPVYMNEERGLYVEGNANIRADYVLYAKGDSMKDARILDGDIVFIRSQPEVENGSIAAVGIGDEATLKRVFYYPGRNMVILKAANPAYEDMIYVGEEISQIRVLGLAIAFQSDVR